LPALVAHAPQSFALLTGGLVCAPWLTDSTSIRRSYPGARYAGWEIVTLQSDAHSEKSTLF
jgi:hypothetical protein